MLESAKNKLTNIKVSTIMGMPQKNTGTDGKNSQGPNLEQLDQENKVVLDFNSKYKINIDLIND